MSEIKEYNIDLKSVFSVDELHELLAEVLPLPDYYGGTLDALYDVLTDEGMNWSIHFTGTDEAEAILGKYMRNFKKMCRKAAEFNEEREITFED
ncbi:MAG: barstar family protein [Lachnospiraceae bacterium]|nr:barstar family protein [Lachnospiraceae bacterium]